MACAEADCGLAAERMLAGQTNVKPT
jgi:hypothetical protein